MAQPTSKRPIPTEAHKPTQPNQPNRPSHHHHRLPPIGGEKQQPTPNRNPTSLDEDKKGCNFKQSLLRICADLRFR